MPSYDSKKTHAKFYPPGDLHACCVAECGRRATYLLSLYIEASATTYWRAVCSCHGRGDARRAIEAELRREGVELPEAFPASIHPQAREAKPLPANVEQFESRVDGIVRRHLSRRGRDIWGDYEEAKKAIDAMAQGDHRIYDRLLARYVKGARL